MTNETREQEVWRTFPDCSLIEASNLGRIRIKDRYTKTKKGLRFVKGRVLKQIPQRNGYTKVRFSVDNKKFYLFTHRIVATCFCPNPNNYPEVNHIDCDRTNNVASNLEWCTHEYNMQYREKYGEATGHHVFVVNLRTFKVLKFRSLREAGRQLGIDNSDIAKVVKGKISYAGEYWFTENESEITKDKIREIKDSIPSGVIAVDLNSFKVIWFKSQREAERQLGVSRSQISRVVRGELNVTGGYWFINVDENVVEKTRVKFSDKMADKIEKLISDMKVI